MYQVKAVKTFRGHDGNGFNANLYRGNKKVAEITDLADGAEYQIHWVDHGTWIEFEARNYKDEMFKRRGTPEEKKFYDFIKDKKYTFHGRESYHSADTYIGGLVEKVLEKQQHKKWCRKGMVIRMKDDPEGEWRILGIKYSKAAAAAVREKYGEELEEILNERYAA